MASKEDERGWFSRLEMVEIFDVSEVQFDRRFAKLAPAAGVHRDKRKVTFHARKLIDALIADEVASAAPKPPPLADEADALLASGGDSPNLERYRLAKAQLAERDLAERDKQIVRRLVITDAMRPSVVGMRRAGELLTKRFGNDAGEVFNDAVNDLEAGIQRLIDRLSGDSDDVSGRAANDSGVDGPDEGAAAPDA